MKRQQTMLAANTLLQCRQAASMSRALATIVAETRAGNLVELVI
jgi:hypothetical protein